MPMIDIDQAEKQATENLIRIVENMDDKEKEGAQKIADWFTNWFGQTGYKRLARALRYTMENMPDVKL